MTEPATPTDARIDLLPCICGGEVVSELRCSCNHGWHSSAFALEHNGDCPCCPYCRAALRRYELAKAISERLDASDDEESPDHVLSHREIIADELARWRCGDLTTPKAAS